MAGRSTTFDNYSSTIATTLSQAEHPALKISILRLELMFTPPAAQSLHPVPTYKVKRQSGASQLRLRG